MQRYVLIAIFILLSLGCRQRQWDQASGVLDGPRDPAGENWRVRCVDQTASAADDAAKSGWTAFQFDLRGINPTATEPQPIGLTVREEAGGVLFEAKDPRQNLARGQINVEDVVFVAFQKGALTAFWSADLKAYEGVMSLPGDVSTAAVNVACSATTAAPPVAASETPQRGA